MPEPGWYQDPNDEHLLRRWDGTAWTGETRSSERTPAPPSGSPLVALVEPLGTWERRFSVLAFWLGIPGIALAAWTWVPSLLYELDRAPFPSTGLYALSDLASPLDGLVFAVMGMFFFGLALGVLNIIWERVHFSKAFVIAAAIQFALWVGIGVIFVADFALMVLIE